MRSRVKAAMDFTKRTSLSKAFLAGLTVFALTACGGGDGDGGGLCASPQITSAPPTYATVNQQYRYITESAYQCFSFLNPYACSGVQGVQLPAGAYASGNIVSWTPAPYFGGTAVQFKIATPPDACNHQATQAWTVHVASPPPDTTPPAVTYVSPGDLESNVPITSTISAAFSELIDPSSVDLTSFVVSGPAGYVPGTILATDKAATFTPSGDLPEFSNISITLTTAIKDIAGNALPSNFAWSFTTGMGPDINPPTVPSPSATYIGGSRVHFQWEASVDDVRVQGYKVRRDGTLLRLVSAQQLGEVDWGLNFNTTYCYTVSSIDSSGNESAVSSPLCMTTLEFVPGRVSYWVGGNAPDLLPYIDSVSSIASNSQYAAAIKSDGSVWQWISEYDVPTLVPNISNPVALVGADYQYFLAIGSDATVWSWGYNTYGQFGDGTTDTQSVYQLTPVQMLNVGQAVAVAGGNAHSLVVKSDGTVWAVGGNWCGQLGDGTTIKTRTTAIQVPNLEDVVSVAANHNQSLALKSDGSIWMWGSSGMPPSTTCEASMPEQIPGISNFTAISQGFYFSLALRADGTVWAWGVNDSGQLGDGTNVDRAVPGQVVGLSNVVAIASRPYSPVALKADGTVWQWGRDAINLPGSQWGNSNVPVQVTKIGNVSKIASGHHGSLALR